MSYELLDDNPKKIRLRTITSSQIISLATFLNNTSEVGEPLYATDSKQLYIHDGTSYEQIGLVRTSTTADPTTTEYPNDKDAGIHKNTTSGDVFLAYNDGGSTIVKVQLS